MCIPGRSRKTAPRPHGMCRWMTSDPRELIDAGMPAPLMIQVERGSGLFVGYYWLGAVEGGWLLTREEKGQSAEHYHLSRDFWNCTCPAIRDHDGECKHTLAVRAALKRIGIIKE